MLLTLDQVDAILDRFMETHPLLPAQGTEARAQWFVDLVRMAYSEGMEAGRMLPIKHTLRVPAGEYTVRYEGVSVEPKQGYPDPREQHLEDIKNR